MIYCGRTVQIVECCLCRSKRADKKGGAMGEVLGPLVGVSSGCHALVSTTSPRTAKRFREERERERDDVDACPMTLDNEG